MNTKNLHQHKIEIIYFTLHFFKSIYATDADVMSLSHDEFITKSHKLCDIVRMQCSVILYTILDN